jgi:hypothetical protein
MSAWGWALISAGIYVGLSLLFGAVVAATFRRISGPDRRQLESGLWRDAPLARDLREEQEALANWVPLSDRVARHVRVSATHGWGVAKRLPGLGP